MKFSKSSLDIDNYVFVDIEKIIAKICSCRHLVRMKITPSLNGWHIRLICYKPCDVCRLVFDDQDRFSLDEERPAWLRNVLFDEKVPVTHHRLFKTLLKRDSLMSGAK